MAAGDEIIEVHPGQVIDPVESLARAIHETAIDASVNLGQVPDESRAGWRGFDATTDDVRSFRREQARLLLERMNR